MRAIKVTTYLVCTLFMIWLLPMFVMAAASSGTTVIEYVYLLAVLLYFAFCILLAHKTTGRRYEQLGAWLAFGLALLPVGFILWMFNQARGFGC